MSLFKSRHSFTPVHVKMRGLALFEFLTVCCVIFVLIGTFAVYANRILKAARETALQYELLNIRMSVEYYRIINARLPGDLRELTKKRLTSSKFDNKISNVTYLQPIRVDSQGFLLDPFMNRYVYDSKSGRVSVQTKGYETW